MTAIAYPSAEIPGPVKVQVDVPDGWQVEAAPGVAFVAASPEEVGGIHTNAVVSVRRIDAQIGLDQLAEVVAEELAGLPGYEAVRTEEIRLGDRDGSVHSYRFVGDDGTVVAQTQALCVAQVTEHLADVVTLTVTHGDGVDPDGLEAIRSMVESLRVG